MQFNWMAIAVAAVSSLVVGFIWYHPKVFGTAWMKTIGMKEEDAKGANMALVFGVTLLVAFFAAFFLTVQVTIGEHHTDPQFMTFKHGAFHGTLVALMVGMPVLVTNALYERRSARYMLINVGYWVTCFAVMGGIVSAWR